MGHFCNFLLDILCILGVHSITFCIARMHSFSAYFIDYIRMHPQINVDGMLDNCKRSLAGYRMAGKYLAIIQPFSALLANAKFRSEHSMHAYMEPSLALLREWESCLAYMALVIRSSIALHRSRASRPMSACFHCPAVHISCSGPTDTMNWQTNGRSACLGPLHLSQGQPRPVLQVWLGTSCVAMLHIASQSNMCSAKACKLAHVCVVPDCPDSSAQGSNPGTQSPRMHCTRRSFVRKEAFPCRFAFPER